MSTAQKYLSATCLSFAIVLLWTAMLTAAEHPGWYVEVDIITTQAEAIDFYIGKPGEPYTRNFWTRWSLGDDNEIEVPIEMQGEDNIRIKAVTVPENTEAAISIAYKDETPQRISFTGTLEKIFSKTFLSE